MATLRRDAVPYNTVICYLHDGHCSPSSQRTASVEVSRALDDSDEAILSSLDDNLFASRRQLSRLTHIPSTTVYRRITNSLGFTAHHFRWSPNTLSQAQKKQRVELTRQLLRTLQIQCDRTWHDFVTLDESWFYLTTDHEFIWLPESGEVFERERPIIQSTKVMLTIVWNPREFHSVNILAKRYKFNNTHYITEILLLLSE
jgi:hypothetical protein